MDSHVGVHHPTGLRSEFAGVASGRLQLRERACCLFGRFGPGSVSPRAGSSFSFFRQKKKKGHRLVQPVLPLWKQWFRLGALGIYLDTVMAPHPLGLSGPMAGSSDDNRNTRRGFDTFQTPRTNMCEVSSCNSFRANNTTLEFPCDQWHLGKVQHPSLQKTCQGSLQNRWSIRQTRVRHES